MIKTIFMDLDGTLLNKNGHVSEHTKKVLNDLPSKGINYFIATGRPFQLLKGIIKDLEYSKEVITMNGSVVLNSLTHSIVSKNIICQNTVKKIINKAIECDYLIMLYGEDAIYSDDNERVRYFTNQFKEKPKTLHPKFIALNQYQGEDISKILIVEHDSKRYEYFKSFVSKFDVSVVQSQKGFLDINPIGVSKGKAVKAIMAKYNFKKDEVIAFGDQENDLTMKDYVTKFIAMDNATNNVKKIADDITLSNTQDGVAYWIKNNILN